MLPRWLVALLVLLRERWSARRDAHVRFLKPQVEILRSRLPGNRVIPAALHRRGRTGTRPSPNVAWRPAQPLLPPGCLNPQAASTPASSRLRGRSSGSAASHARIITARPLLPAPCLLSASTDRPALPPQSQVGRNTWAISAPPDILARLLAGRSQGDRRRGQASRPGRRRGTQARRPTGHLLTIEPFPGRFMMGGDGSWIARRIGGLVGAVTVNARRPPRPERGTAG